MNNSIVLLKTLLMSTSGRNIFRYTKDKKKRRKIIGNTVGAAILYLMLMAYSVAMCVGYGQFGLIGSAPVMCALIISILGFMFTLFKTNGYLFNFKEYDMLMALPFEAKTVAASKFLYMYIKSLPWYLSISLAMLIGYGIYARPAIAVYPIWMILSLFLPIIPMLIASFIGYLIAKISSGFRKTNIIQTVLTMLFVLFCFSLRFIIEEIFRDDKIQATLETASQVTSNAAGYYPPAGWFTDAVTRLNIPAMLLLIGVTAALFLLVFRIVGQSYTRINSALKSHAASRNYRMSAQKQRSVVNAIAFKEFRRLTGSTTYMVNAGVGVILASIVSVMTLIIGPDQIIGTVTQGAPIDSAMLRPAIPFIVHFFIGMVATTACSPSLEGKNFWIIQSLPVEMTTVSQGKMLFNMYLTVPFSVFSVLCLSVAAKAPAFDTVLYAILSIALCAFSTAWGCVCGLKHMKLDWENEIEVIKQGTAVAVYMLPNMFAVMGLTVLVVFLGTKMDQRLLTLALIAVTALLAALCYLWVMALSRKRADKR